MPGPWSVTRTMTTSSFWIANNSTDGLRGREYFVAFSTPTSSESGSSPSTWNRRTKPAFLPTGHSGRRYARTSKFGSHVGSVELAGVNRLRSSSHPGGAELELARQGIVPPDPSLSVRASPRRSRWGHEPKRASSVSRWHRSHAELESLPVIGLVE